MLESVIESYLVKEVKSTGGEVRKFVSPGRRHAPDRIVLYPQGRIRFVECKAPGKKPRAGQVREHARLRKMGFVVEVIDCHDDVDRLVYEMTGDGT